MPTKNRAEYLQYAIKSILNQTFQDFEIVVSDNNSTDGTEKVVKNFKDSRIRYYNTKMDIPLTANWNNAYSFTEGKYFILMGDDDYFFPYALEDYYNAIKQSGAEILHSRYGKYEYGNRMLTYPSGASNQVENIDRGKYLSDFFNFLLHIVNTTNCCISRNLAKKIEENGDFYQGPFPEYFALTAAILKTDKLVYLGKTLSLLGVTPKSNGPALMDFKLRRTALTDDFGREYTTPLKAKIISNGLYITYALLLSKYPSELKTYSINLRQYYIHSGNWLILNLFRSIISLNLVFIRECSSEFIEFLIKAPKITLIEWIIRLPIKLAITITPRPLVNYLNNFSLNHRFTARLLSIVGLSRPNESIVHTIKFKKETTIEEAAKLVFEADK